jgi:hypothetical protein
VKAKPQKMGNPGKVGQVATKKGSSSPDKSIGVTKLDHKTVGSAIGLLGKHYK